MYLHLQTWADGWLEPPLEPGEKAELSAVFIILRKSWKDKLLALSSTTSSSTDELCLWFLLLWGKAHRRHPPTIPKSLIKPMSRRVLCEKCCRWQLRGRAVCFNPEVLHFSLYTRFFSGKAMTDFATEIGCKGMPTYQNPSLHEMKVRSRLK